MLVTKRRAFRFMFYAFWVRKSEAQYQKKAGVPCPEIEQRAALPRRLKKTLCRTELLLHVFLKRSQCHTAAAEGAKLSTIKH